MDDSQETIRKFLLILDAAKELVELCETGDSDAMQKGLEIAGQLFGEMSSEEIEEMKQIVLQYLSE